MAFAKTAPTLDERLATIAGGAEDRHAAGHSICAVALLPIHLPHWGDFIEAIESRAWKLEHLVIAVEGHAVAVFRRT